MIKLTKKQKGFVKDYVQTGIGSLAVKENYDVINDNTARSIASENLTKPAIIEEIEKVSKTLAERIPDSLLEEKHIALLEKLEMKRTFNQDIGEWIEIETGQIDTIAVSKGLDMAYKLKGAYAPEKSIATNVNINVSSKELEIANKYEEEIKKNL